MNKIAVSLEEQTTKTVKKMEKIERNWHIFKAVLYVLGAVLISTVITYKANQIETDNLKTRRLIQCMVPAFTPENYINAGKIVDKCTKDNQ